MSEDLTILFFQYPIRGSAEPFGLELMAERLAEVLSKIPVYRGGGVVDFCKRSFYQLNC